ncbi:hypothetical protein MMC25_003681 [Agyrium rufum]|nr:hypothetical protein [Agyrium rufum]
MGLTSREDLQIAYLAFYGPALLVSAVVAFKHGLQRSTGWIFLVLLAIIRIAGAGLTLYTDNETNPSKTLLTTADILASVGLSPLLGAMLGLISRAHTTMLDGRGLKQLVFRILGLLSTVALILAIIGGIDASKDDTTDQKNGKDLTKAGILLFVLAYLLQSALTLFTWTKARYLVPEGRNFLIAVTLSIPFLAVRFIYSLLGEFDTSTTTFSPLTGNVLVQGLMSALPEFATVIIYLVAGFLTQKTGKAKWQQGKYSGPPPG